MGNVKKKSGDEGKRRYVGQIRIGAVFGGRDVVFWRPNKGKRHRQRPSDIKMQKKKIAGEDFP